MPALLEEPAAYSRTVLARLFEYHRPTTGPQLPAERLLLLTAESRLPFPEIPGPIRVLPAWQWMLEAGD